MLNRVTLLAALALLLAGCGRDPGYQSVSGLVRFKGQPLDQGSIQFCRTGEQTGVYAGAMIANGRYVVPKEHGLKPGTYLVRISSTVRDESKASEMNPFLTRERIAASFNASSKLTVEVRAGEPGDFNFDVE
jgi:hypothetical protein